MKKINFTGITGLILCMVAILFGVATNGGLSQIVKYLHIPSLIVTLGGSLCAVMATSDSFSEYLDGLKSIFTAYQVSTESAGKIAEEILGISEIARKEGLLSLEEYSSNMDNEFLRKGIRLIVDGCDPELVRDIMENELTHREERNRIRIRFWQNLGAYAPAWGMLGTLIGLIDMMRSMGMDANSIGAGMSLALITTLYGSLLANWICIPVSEKLRDNNERECLVMEIIIEGILSVQAGENSRIIKEKINSILEYGKGADKDAAA